MSQTKHLTKESLTLYLRLLRYAKPYWPGFMIAAASMVLIAATETAFPALMKPMMDNGFTTETAFPLWWVPAGVLGIFLVRGIAGFTSSYSMSWIANNVLRDLRQAMFGKLITMPAASFDAKSSGQLISRIIAEVNGVTAAATNVVNTLVRDSLILLGLIAWLFWINWQLTLTVLILAPLLIISTLAFSKRMRSLSRGALGATGDMTRVVEEAIQGNRVIKIFQADDFEKDRFSAANMRYRGQVMRLSIAQALQTPISQLIAALGVSVVLTIALIQSRAGHATIGDFVSFITAMLMMFGPLRHLADVNSQLQRGLAAAEAVFALIDEKSEKDTGTVEIQRAIGHIQFENLGMLYPGKAVQALRDVSIDIKQNSTTAIVGPSGSGKTTLVNLLPRLYEPTSGRILLDGIPLNEITLNSLRNQISLVSQDIVLFNETLFNNVLYGRPEATDVEVRNAIEMADLTPFVNSLPQGDCTVIGDKGVRLSGGQRQRIAIARAILKDAPILIFDEATSALDSASEQAIKKSLNKLSKGRTTILIAHRLETIKDADQIVVLDHGRVVERGTHEDLLALNGLYAALNTRNMKSN